MLVDTLQTKAGMKCYSLQCLFAVWDSGPQLGCHSNRYLGAKSFGSWEVLGGLCSWAERHCFSDAFGVLLLAHLGFAWYLIFIWGSKTGRCKPVTQSLWCLPKLACFFWKVVKVQACWWCFKKLKLRNNMLIFFHVCVCLLSSFPKWQMVTSQDSGLVGCREDLLDHNVI